MCVAALASVAAIKSFGSARSAGGVGGISAATASSGAYGCSNWDSIQIAYYEGKTLEQCLDECGNFNTKTGANLCQAVNYQLDAACTGEKGSPGSCYLFRAGCQKEPNDCFEFYDYSGVDSSDDSSDDSSASVPQCKQGGGSMVTNTPCKCGTSVCPRPAFDEPPMTCTPQGLAGQECAPARCPASDATKYEHIDEQGGYPCRCGDRNCTSLPSGVPQYCSIMRIDDREIGSCLPLKCEIESGDSTGTKIDTLKTPMPCLCDGTDICPKCEESQGCTNDATTGWPTMKMHCQSKFPKGAKCSVGNTDHMYDHTTTDGP